MKNCLKEIRGRRFRREDKDQEEFTIDDYLEEDEIPDYRLHADNYNRDDDKKAEIPFSVDQHSGTPRVSAWSQGPYRQAEDPSENT